MANVQVFQCQTNGGGTGVLPSIGSITPSSTLATFAPYGFNTFSQFIDFGWMQPEFNPAADVVCIVPDTGSTVNVQFRNGAKQAISTPTYITAPTFRP